MSSRLQQYRQKKARGGLRSDLRLPLIMFGVSGAFGVGAGLVHLDSVRGWFWLVGGLAFGAIAYGIWKGRGWCRWPAAVILAISGVHGVVRIFADGPGYRSVFDALVFCAFAVYLALPSTAELFAASRETADGDQAP